MRALVALISLLLAAEPIDDLRPRRASGWAGFGEGTWIRFRRSTKRNNKWEFSSDYKCTLRKITQSRLYLENQTKSGGGAFNISRGLGQQKVEALSPETLVVDGQSLKCTVRRFTWRAKDRKSVATVWEAKNPLVMVKLESTSWVRGHSRRFTRTLTHLGVPMKVGARTLRCAVYATKGVEIDRQNEGVLYLRPDVPGGNVFSRGTFTSKKGREVHVRELLDFEAR